MKAILAFGRDTYGPISTTMFAWLAEMLKALTPVIGVCADRLVRRCGRVDGTPFKG